MKIVLGIAFSFITYATQCHASGCGFGLNVELGKQLTEIVVPGLIKCWGPGHSDLFRCQFSPVNYQISALDAPWLESSSLPATDTSLEVTVRVYEALLYNECEGPDIGSPPNGFYYEAQINGAEYTGYKYYNSDYLK